jgi:hypothetical protein
MRILVFIFIQFYVLTAIGQKAFYKLYSGSGFDEGHGVVQLDDSSYVITGSSGSFSEHSQAFLLGVDKYGNYSWSKSFGGAESDLGKRVLHIPNDGFLIAGYSNSYGEGDFDAFLIKTDLKVNPNWVRNYNLPSSWEKINDAVLTSDSGVVMVGEFLPTANGNSDIYIIRTDKFGDTLWTKRWGSDGEDFASSIEQKKDHFIIAGQWYISDSSLCKGFLMEIDGDGNLIWKDTISDLGGNYTITDISLSNSKIFIVGKNEIETKTKGYFGIYDIYGNFLKQYTLEINEGKIRCAQLKYISKFDKVAVAYQYINSSSFQDDFDLMFAYFDSQNLYWLNEFKSINNEKSDDVGEVLATSDGGFIGIGYSNSIGINEFTSNGGSHIYLFKVGADNVFPETENISFLNQLVSVNSIQKFVAKVYPNPVQTILNIQFKEQGTFEYELFDLYGKEILSGCLSQFDQINFSELPKGIYFLNSENSITRIVKE